MQTLQKIVKLFIWGHVTKRYCHVAFARTLCVRFDSKIRF